MAEIRFFPAISSGLVNPVHSQKPGRYDRSSSTLLPFSPVCFPPPPEERFAYGYHTFLTSLNRPWFPAPYYLSSGGLFTAGAMIAAYLFLFWQSHTVCAWLIVFLIRLTRLMPGVPYTRAYGCFRLAPWKWSGALISGICTRPRAPPDYQRLCFTKIKHAHHSSLTTQYLFCGLTMVVLIR